MGVGIGGPAVVSPGVHVYQYGLLLELCAPKPLMPRSNRTIRKSKNVLYLDAAPPSVARPSRGAFEKLGMQARGGGAAGAMN